jgi:hypothetical protein
VLLSTGWVVRVTHSSPGGARKWVALTGPPAPATQTILGDQPADSRDIGDLSPTGHARGALEGPPNPCVAYDLNNVGYHYDDDSMHGSTYMTYRFGYDDDQSYYQYGGDQQDNQPLFNVRAGPFLALSSLPPGELHALRLFPPPPPPAAACSILAFKNVICVSIFAP